MDSASLNEPKGIKYQNSIEHYYIMISIISEKFCLIGDDDVCPSVSASHLG